MVKFLGKGWLNLATANRSWLSLYNPTVVINVFGFDIDLSNYNNNYNNLKDKGAFTNNNVNIFNTKFVLFTFYVDVLIIICKMTTRTGVRGNVGSTAHA